MTSGSRAAAPLYLLGSVAIGLGMGMPGPSLAMLKAQVGVGTGAIGVLFTAQGFGYLLASQIIARGYDRGWGHRLQGWSMLAAAAGFAAVAEVTTVGGLAAVFVVLGLSIGTVDVGSNTHLVWGKGERAGGWLAALHLAFGVGALSSPLVSRWSESQSGTVTIAFRTPALLAAVLGVGVLVTRAPRPLVPAAASPELATPPRRPAGLMLFVGFAFLYVGAEVGFTSWLNTYARDIGHPVGTAAALNSLFWVTYTLGRVANLRIARSATSFRPLVIAAAVAAAAATILIPLDRGASWVAVGVVGLVVGPQFPLLVALVGRRVALTGTTMGWFMGAAGLGSLTWPWLIGELIDRQGPRAFPIAVAALFAGATLFARFGSTRLTGRVGSGAERGVHHRGRRGFVADEPDPRVVLTAEHEQHELAGRPADDHLG